MVWLTESFWTMASSDSVPSGSRRRSDRHSPRSAVPEDGAGVLATPVCRPRQVIALIGMRNPDLPTASSPSAIGRPEIPTGQQGLWSLRPRRAVPDRHRWPNVRGARALARLHGHVRAREPGCRNSAASAERQAILEVKSAPGGSNCLYGSRWRRPGGSSSRKRDGAPRRGRSNVDRRCVGEVVECCAGIDGRVPVAPSMRSS